LEAVFSYLKSGLYGAIEKEEIYELENYCIRWKIRGSKWYKEDWNYPAGQTECAQATKIEKLNILRKIVVTPLIELKQKIEKGTAKEIGAAIYNFLEEENIREKLNSKIKHFMQLGEIYSAEEYKKSFDSVVDILDEMVMIFGGEKISFSAYSKILRSGSEA